MPTLWEVANTVHAPSCLIGWQSRKFDARMPASVRELKLADETTIQLSMPSYPYPTSTSPAVPRRYKANTTNESNPILRTVRWGRKIRP